MSEKVSNLYMKIKPRLLNYIMNSPYKYSTLVATKKQNIFIENWLCLNILVFLFSPIILKNTQKFLLIKPFYCSKR